MHCLRERFGGGLAPGWRGRLEGLHGAGTGSTGELHTPSAPRVRDLPFRKAWLEAGPAWSVAGMLWFMSRIPSFRELLATGEIECRALVDALVAKASQAKPPVSMQFILAMKP